MTSVATAAAPLRVLALHAHPDDVEFQCAGTLALLAAQGHSLTIATMTPGDCGSRELSAEEIAATRRQEARQAAALLGAVYDCLEFRDLSIVIDNDAKRRVTEAIRRHCPDVVFTAPPVDYMDDHEATSHLVRAACFNASCPNYATRQWDPAAPTERIPHLYYVDCVEGVDLWGQAMPPQFYVDISRTFELKARTLACHESQRSWLRSQHGIDEYMEIQRRWGARRGSEIGAAYAEGFRQHLGHPYPSDNLLATLLPGDFREHSG